MVTIQYRFTALLDSESQAYIVEGGKSEEVPTRSQAHSL